MPNFSDTLRTPPSVPPPPAYADGVLIDRSKVPTEGPYLVGDRIKMLDSFSEWYQEGETAVLVRTEPEDSIFGGTGWWVGYVPGRETCFYVAPADRGSCWKLL